MQLAPTLHDCTSLITTSSKTQEETTCRAHTQQAVATALAQDSRDATKQIQDWGEDQSVLYRIGWCGAVAAAFVPFDRGSLGRNETRSESRHACLSPQWSLD